MEQENSFVPTFENLISILKEHYDHDIEHRILNVYIWGSRVYGTSSPQSDYDFIIITKFNTENEIKILQKRENVDDIDKPYPVYEDDQINATFIPIDHFRMMLATHRHMALEAYFAPKKFVIKEDYKLEFNLDLDVLRRTVYKECMVRYKTARTKFVKGEIMTGKKYLFHSIRYRIFASQIAEKGQLTDYSVANSLWDQIKSDPLETWKEIDDKYKIVFENSRELFRSASEGRVFAFHGRRESAAKWWNAIRGRWNDGNEVAKKIEENSGKRKLEIVKLLQESGSTEVLKRNSISFIRHSKYPNLLLLFHNFWDKVIDEIGKECEGKCLIVDSNKNFEVVCYSFPKIHHYGNHPFQSSTFRVFEMIDGLHCCLYYYNDEWHLSNGYEPNNPQSKVCYGHKEDHFETTFEKMFWEIWEKMNYQLPTNTERCYTFVLSSYMHRYVVKYEKETIKLVAVRDLFTMSELDPVKVASENQWLCANEYTDFDSIESIQKVLQESNPFLLKGFILLVSNFNRVQICHKFFQGINMGTDFSTVGSLNWTGDLDEKHALDLIRFNHENLFLYYFPERTTFVQQIKEKFEKMVETIEKAWNELNVLSPKDFGVKAQSYWFAFLLFKLQKKTSWIDKRILCSV